MAASVSITITVDASQSGQAIGALTAQMNDLGVKGEIAMKKVGGSMAAAGAPALRFSNAMQELGGHFSSSLDSVRLLSQEFGLRLPRAMEAMLSRVPAVTSGLNAVLSGVVAIASVEVFMRAVEGAEAFYKKLFDVNAAMREYLGTAGKAASQKLFDEASLETSIALLKQANDQVAQLESKRVASGADTPGGGFLQYVAKVAKYTVGTGEGTDPDIASQMQAGSPIYSASDGQRQATAAADAALARARKQQLEQERAIERLKDQLAAQADAAPAGQRAAIERDNAKRISDQERQNQVERERTQQEIERTTRAKQIAYGMKENDPKLTQVHSIDPNAGRDDQRTKDLKADEDYQAKATVLGRETALALMKADDERIQASLTGEALLQEKRKDDVRELTLQLTNEGKLQELKARTAAINDKYAGDESERLVKLQNETAQAAQRAQLGGLTGAARAYAERDQRVGQINSDPKLAANPDAASSERLAAQTELYQKLKELDDNFTASARELIAQRTADQVGAFARIDAEAQKSAAAQRKAYDTAYKDAAGHDTATVQQHQVLVDALAAIDKDAAAKKSELRERNAAEDLQYDQQAAQAERRVREDGIMGWVAAYKDGIVEIQAQEAERLAKAREDLDKGAIEFADYQRRKADIEREANAEVAQQNQQLQHQIAGNLQAAFTDPIGFIKGRMEQMFFEIVAAWIMRMQVFKSLFGDTMGSLAPGGAGRTGTAGALDTVIGAMTHGGGMRGLPAAASTGGGVAMPNPGGGASGGGGFAMPGGIPGTRGPVNGHADISSIYGTVKGAIPASIPSSASNVDLTGDAGGFNGPMTGDTPDFTPAEQAARQAGINVPAGAGSSASTGLNAAGQIIGVGAAGYTFEQSTVSAFESDNPLKGAIGDASSGAAIGGMFGGPMGAAIGAGVGAAVGAAAGTLGYVTGMGGNMAARSYYEKEVYPQLQSEWSNAGNGDFQSEIADANRTAASAMSYMASHFGRSSADWVNDHYLKKELARVTSLIENTAKGGRFATTQSAMQFHSGGPIGGFGSFATSGDEGYIHARLGETVMVPGASREHGPMLAAMNAGASATDIASRYLAASSQRTSGGGATYNAGDFHVHTLDTKTMSSWLRNGGAQMIAKHQNDFNGQYAGDGISG